MSNRSAKTVQLVASGDLRLAANQTCWPAQKAMEEALAKALKASAHTMECRKRTHDGLI